MEPAIDTRALSAFALLWLVILPTPGPNQMMVAHVALSQGPRQIALAIAGNLSGIALWCLSALFGLAVLLSAVPAARIAVSLAGGAYLVWTGLGMLRAAGRRSPHTLQAAAALPAFGDRQAYAIGLATALSNAQAVLFISSVFAVSGVVGASLATGLLAAALLLSLNAVYLSGLGWLMQRPAAQAFYGRWRPTMERVFGLIFMAFGARLLASALLARG